MSGKYFHFIAFTLLAIVFTLFFGVLTLHDSDIGFVSDDAIYLLTAQYYSPWFDTTYPVFEHAHNVTRFPPMYPIVLGLLGAGTKMPEFALMLNSLMLVGFLLTFAKWVYKESGRLYVAIGLSLALGFLPSTLLMSIDLWSEFLFGGLVFLALLTFHRDDVSTTRWLLVALIVALVPLTRTIGLSLVIAFGLFVIIKKPLHRISLISISVFPIVLWLLYRSIVMTDESYLGTLINTLTATRSEQSLSNLTELIYTRVVTLWDSWRWIFLVGEAHKLSVILVNLIIGLLLILSLIGLMIRLRKFQLDAMYITVYVLVVFAWPYSNVYFTSRFLFAIFPILLFYAWFALSRFVGRGFKPGYSTTILLTALLLIALPLSTSVVTNAMASIDPDLRPFSRSRQGLRATSVEDVHREATFRLSLTKSLREAREFIPSDACVFSVQTPIAMVHLKRVAYGVPKPHLSDDEFDVQSKACRYFVLMGIRTGGDEIPMFYPLERLRHRSNYQFAFFEDENKNPMVIVAERKFDSDYQ